MNYLINAHIDTTTYECSAEREIQYYTNAERSATALMIVCAISVVGLLIASAAYAVPGPKLSLAV